MRSRKDRTTTATASYGTIIAYLLALLGLVLLAAYAPAQAAPQQATVTYDRGQSGKITGYILTRKGDDMLVRDETTKQLTLVSITAATRIESPTGFLSLDRKSQPPTTLIPGLLIEVKGSGGVRGNLVADKIKFHKSALRVASQISAGEVELRAQQRQTAANVAAARDSLMNARERARDSIDALTRSVNARINNLDDYDTKGQTTVFFATGSAVLTPDDMRRLDELFAKSRSLDGVLFEVKGFADSRGATQLNQMLSAARADAVAAYLTEAHGVPPRRIASPSGLGSTLPVAPNSTTNGRAMNRRVEVRLLVNRGIKSTAKP